MRWGLRENVFEDDKSKETRTKLPIEEIHKLDIEISSEPRLNLRIQKKEN